MAEAGQRCASPLACSHFSLLKGLIFMSKHGCLHLQCEKAGVCEECKLVQAPRQYIYLGNGVCVCVCEIHTLYVHMEFLRNIALYTTNNYLT